MPPPADTALFPTILHPKKRAVLLAYVACGLVKPACKASGTAFSMHYYWRKHDPAYAEAWAEAEQLGAVMLEDEAIRRARDGVERTIFHQGVPIGTEHRYSDVLLIFLLKGAKPEKYQEHTEHHHSGEVEHTHTWQERLASAHASLEERRNGHVHTP
jgi:hypothetical protein